MSVIERGIEFSQLPSFPDRVKPFSPLMVSTEPLKYAGVNNSEFYQNRGITGAVVHFGNPVTRLDAIREVIANFEMTEQEATDMLDRSTGFNFLYRRLPGLTAEQLVEQELNVVRKTVLKVLEISGWRPEEVKGVFIGSGTPPIIGDDVRYADYAQVVADMCDIPSGVRENVYAACNSGFWAMADAMDTRIHPELQHQKVLVGAIDNLTRILPQPIPIYSDKVSPIIFSNGAAFVALEVGDALKLLTRSHGINVDTKRGLPAKATYQTLMDPIIADSEKNSPNAYQVKGYTHMLALPDPSTPQYPNRGVDMSPIRTVQLFIGKDALPRFIAEEEQQYQTIFPGRIRDYSLAHSANRLIMQKIADMHERDYHTKLDLPWVMYDGNSSSPTTLMTLLRSINNGKFQPGAHWRIISFGAGASFDVATVGIG